MEEYALLQQAPDPNAQENCTLSGVPNEAYHAARGVSKSDLSEILDWTPAHWKAVAWKTVGGYGNQGTGQVRDNSARERVWFSPHCLFPETLPLFDVEEVS